NRPKPPARGYLRRHVRFRPFSGKGINRRSIGHCVAKPLCAASAMQSNKQLTHETYARSSLRLVPPALPHLNQAADTSPKKNAIVVLGVLACRICIRQTEPKKHHLESVFMTAANPSTAPLSQEESHLLHALLDEFRRTWTEERLAVMARQLPASGRLRLAAL